MKPIRMTAAALSGIALMLFALSGPTWGDEKKEGKVADLVKEAKIPIDQAIKTASEKVAGTVVEAELEKKKDKVVWEVEVVASDGKVTEVHVDAGSGDVIATKEKKEEKKVAKKKEEKAEKK